MFTTRLSIMAVLTAWSLCQIAPAAAQEALPGQRLFKNQCSVCHQVVAGQKGIGPNLFGVVGRPAGSLPDFKYTDANKNSHLTWDAATLDQYLVAPRDLVPGTSMPYPGLTNEAQRAELIAYLASLK